MVARVRTVLYLCGLVAAVSGCVEIDQVTTLNPDGSGKMQIEAKFRLTNVFTGSKDPETRLKEAVSDILMKSQGVAVWKDVEYKRLDDARIWFKGVAYFRDISAIHMPHVQMQECKWTRLVANRCRLEVKDVPGSESRSRPEPRTLSGEELRKEVVRQRAQYQQMKAFQAAMAQGARWDLAFYLPGRAEKRSNLERTDDGALRVSFDVQKAMKAMDELVKDEAWVRKQVLAGYDVSKHLPMEDPALREKVLGEPGPVKVTVREATKPLFDFDRELAQARGAYEEMIQQLGLKRAIPKPAAGGFERVSLVGVRFVADDDTEDRLLPFGSRSGCVVALTGKFKGAFVEMRGGRVEKAVANTGSSLLPEEEAHRQIAFPYLFNKDRTKILFYLSLRMPEAGVLGLKELSGTLEYTAGSVSKEVDLGFEEFAAGAKGKALGAEITSVGKSRLLPPGDEAVVLRVNVPSYKVKGLALYDASGKPRMIFFNRANTGDKKTSEFHIMHSTLPDGSRLAVVVWEDIQRHEIPFKVTDVSWQGNPLP